MKFPVILGLIAILLLFGCSSGTGGGSGPAFIGERTVNVPFEGFLFFNNECKQACRMAASYECISKEQICIAAEQTGLVEVSGTEPLRDKCEVYLEENPNVLAEHRCIFEEIPVEDRTTVISQDPDTWPCIFTCK